MRLFLIRHGETVDNVAGVYAGSRDSELTNHGYLQATRLGEHFQSSHIEFTHIFSSQLKRAIKTAELVRAAQSTSIDIVRTPLIMEQDFGFYEGKPVLARPLKGSATSGKEAHRALHKDDVGFVDMETKEAMAVRADAFLEEHISANMDKDNVIAVVSHGIMLSVLWRRFLLRLPPNSVTIHHEILATHGRIDLERLGGWSNTGYLELEMTFVATPAPVVPAQASIDNVGETNMAENRTAPLASSSAIDNSAVEDGLSEDQALRDLDPTPTANPSSNSRRPSFTAWTTTVCVVNHKAHLNTLKRTRGGVGSSRHDDRQKSIDSFFKKQKTE